MKQLDDLKVVKPHDVETLTKDQRKNTLTCLMFLIEKNNPSGKAPMCVDRSKQEMDKSECSAPTDALFITLVVDADEGRDVATIYVHFDRWQQSQEVALDSPEQW